MTISKAETGYSERDMVIAAAKALGLTNEEAAEQAGVSLRTVGNRLASNKAFIEGWTARIKGMVREKKAAKLEIKADNFMDEMRARLGKSIEALDRAFEEGSVQEALTASREIRESLFGKSVNRNLNVVAGSVSVQHYHEPMQIERQWVERAAKMIEAGSVPGIGLPVLEGEEVTNAGSVQ